MRFQGIQIMKRTKEKKMLLLEFFLTKRTEKETMQFQKNALPISLKNLELQFFREKLILRINTHHYYLID